MKTDLPIQRYFPFIKYAICQKNVDMLEANGKKLFINTRKAFPVELKHATIFNTYEIAESRRCHGEMVIPVYRA